MRLTMAVLWMLSAGQPAQAQPRKSGALTVLIPTVSVTGKVQTQLGIQPAQLTTLLAQAVTRMQTAEVKTEEDIRAMVQQSAQQQLLGCVEMACALDLGRAAGADLLVRGEAGLVGNRLLVSATLINVQEVRVVGSVTRAVSVEQLANGGLNPLAAELFPAAPTSAGNPGPVGTMPPLPADSLVANPLGGSPVRRERVLVTARQWSNVTEPAVRTTALGKAADVVNAAGGFQAVSSEELKSVLQSDADAQALGSLEASAVQKVADAVKAPYLVTLELGKLGTTYVMGASLVDTKTVDVVNRSSLVFQDVNQLMDAVTVVTRRLLGQSAQLPPPEADPSKLESRLQALMSDAMGKYKELPQGGAMGLVLLPYGEAGAEVKQRKLGTQLATFMLGMGGGAPVTLATPEKLTELKKQHDLSNPMALEPLAFSEMGMFLGAQALMVGSVGDLGTDYLLQVKLVKVAGGQVLWQGNAMFPKARPGALLPKQVKISRSRADAVTRAVVPGLAQFTSGPLGIVRGAVFVAAMAVGVALVPMALAGVAAGVYLWVLHLNSTSGSTATQRFMVGSCFNNSSFGGDGFPAEDANPDCQRGRMIGGGLAAAGGVILAAAIFLALGAYGLSFLDAALLGIQEETVDFEAVH